MPFDADSPEAKAAIKEAVAAAVSEATEGLVTKNRELLAELKESKKGRQVDPAAVEKLESQIETLQNDLAIAQKTAKTATTDADKARKALESESGFTTRLLVDNGLTEQLVKAGVKPSFLPAVKALLAGQVQIKAEGDTRKAMVGDKDLAAHIAEWSQSDQGKEFVVAPNNAGGGAAGGSGGARGASSINRAAFAALNPAAQMAHVKSGGAIVD
jgi:outer membrane murein-binding lipoprotein Lpp